MTLQTTAPIKATHLNATNRRADWFVDLRNRTYGPDSQKGNLELNAPYQRGEVWTVDQQRLLIKSFLLGAPIPAIIINDRFSARFRHDDGTVDWRYTVIDGKQRVTAILAWFDGELAIPTSWLDPEWIENPVDTDDGPYVTSAGLTERGQRIVGSDLVVPIAEGQLPTMAQEAELYLLVNRGGTPHDETDLAAARSLAS